MHLREGGLTSAGLALTALAFGVFIGSPAVGVLGGGLAFVVAFLSWSLVTGRGQRPGPGRGAVVGAITALFVSSAMLPAMALLEMWRFPPQGSMTFSSSDFFRWISAGVLMTGWITIPLGSLVGALILGGLGLRSRRPGDVGTAEHRAVMEPNSVDG